MKLSANFYFTEFLRDKRTIVDKFIKRDIYKNLDIAAVLAEYKKVGFEGIELLMAKTYSTKDYAQVKSVLKNNTISVNSIHQSHRFLTKTPLSEIERLCTIANEFNAKIIVIHSTTIGKQLFDEAFIEKLHAFEKKFGLIFGVENMQKSILSLGKKYSWHTDNFSKLIEKNNLHITLDTTHLGQTGEDILLFFKQNKERIVNIHLSDYKIHRFSSSLRPVVYTHMPLGQGDLPITQFLQLLHKEKYSGLITLEINDTIDKISQSAEIVRTIFK